jgi:guanosine-3',5'-bis(diphosphate) 3'-pyrophosphohydrolase
LPSAAFFKERPCWAVLFFRSCTHSCRRARLCVGCSHATTPRPAAAVEPFDPCPEAIGALIDKLTPYLPDTQIEWVRDAYYMGARAHHGQTRKSGEPYITHPLAVSAILAELGMDVETICAAILHDALEDTDLGRERIADRFGEAVAELVDGVTKLDKISFRDRHEAAAESFRKMMLAMARDLRVILIKLADRLHNMRTIGSMSAEARARIAQETLDVYAPIAQRLGMNRIKGSCRTWVSRPCIRGGMRSSSDASVSSQ